MKIIKSIVILSLSLQTRLYRLFILLSLPGIVAILFSLWYAKENVLKESRMQALAIAQQLTTQQAGLLNEVKNFTVQLARLDDFSAPLKKGCPAYLKKISALNLEIANIGIIDLTGEPRCLLSGMNKNINISDRQYFKNALATKDFAIGFFQKDRSLDTLTVNFAYPLLDENQTPYGVVVSVITLDWWSKKLASFHLPQGTLAIITDSHNRVLANSPYDAKRFGKNISEYGFSDATSGFNNIVDFNGVNHVLHKQQMYKDEVNNTLNAYIAIPFDKDIENANQLFINALITFIIIISIMCVFAHLRLKKAILTPLKQLTCAIQELAKGYLPKQFSLKSPELNSLYEHFEEMAQTRLAAEAHVKRQHSELSSLLSALPDIYIRINIHGDVLNLGGQVSRLNKPVYANSKLHLRDLLDEEKSKQLLQNLPTGKETAQFELQDSDENPKHVYEVRISAKPNSNEYTLVLQDITSRKHAEKASNLASLVYANSSEGMVITDPNAIILDVNPAFCEVTQYRKDEVLGKPISILNSGRHKKSFYKEMWQMIEQSGRWQGEIQNRRKDGELFTEWLTIDTVYDEYGNPHRRVAIFTDITEKKAADELIWHQTHFDHLTNLPNRVELKDRLNQRLSKNYSKDSPLVIMLLDLDHFKDINDTLGHFYGDELLKMIAHRLHETNQDIDFMARIGGDEFVIVHTKIISEDHIKKVAKDLLQAMSQPFLLEEEEIFIAASIGIAIAPTDGDSCEQLLKAADQAMFQAKQNGRNCYEFFSLKLREQAQHRMELLKSMRYGIEQHEFELYYQPIVDLSSEKIHKAEGLMRWQHPVQGLISPAQFIPLAEESRYINPLGQFAFTKALQTLQTLRSIDNSFQLSVNVSPVQFSCLDSGIDKWPQLLHEANLPLNAIVAEITEGLMISQEPLTQQRLKSLERSGMELALDDFGTGYSSLAYLQQMDADYLKIDKCFVDDIKEGNQQLALCKALINMAHQFNLKVIAEGIETREQHHLLLQLGCDYGQGYLFSKPLSEKEFIALVNKQHN